MRNATEEPKFDVRKFEELILVIAHRAPDIGLTKLEKLLYLCDFISAESRGVPITGEMYTHFDRGPVPKHIKRILPAMAALLKQEELPRANKPGKFIKLTPKRKSKNSMFSADEQRTIEDVLQRFGHWTSTELVKYVHDDLTYKATKRNEDIPYSLAIYRRYEKPDALLAQSLRDDPDYIRVLDAALG
jgi:hypothetical protein